MHKGEFAIHRSVFQERKCTPDQPRTGAIAFVLRESGLIRYNVPEIRRSIKEALATTRSQKKTPERITVQNSLAVSSFFVLFRATKATLPGLIV